MRVGRRGWGRHRRCAREGRGMGKGSGGAATWALEEEGPVAAPLRSPSTTLLPHPPAHRGGRQCSSTSSPPLGEDKDERSTEWGLGYEGCYRPTFISRCVVSWSSDRIGEGRGLIDYFWAPVQRPITTTMDSSWIVWYYHQFGYFSTYQLIFHLNP